MTDDEKRLAACYDEAGRLCRYPGRKHLRPYVLGKIAEGFETGRTYTEKEVNAIIGDCISFSDVELIRRELIENRLLLRKRDGSAYWRDA